MPAPRRPAQSPRSSSARPESYPALPFKDEQLFGNDAGEDEDPDVLASYFVSRESFDPFFDRDRRVAVARSRKGMGKSALLAKLAHDLHRQGSDDIVIQTTGSDLLGLAAFPAADHQLLQLRWKQVICARINLELGKRVGFAFSDTKMALVEAAELTGFKGRNLIGSLIARITSSQIPIEVKSATTPDNVSLLKRAAESLGTARVWLLVDDIDATFIDTSEMAARTAAFFSACRSVLKDVQGLNIRASVRTDVWTVLRTHEDLDKFEQYIIDLQWPSVELERILAKRIHAFVSRRFPMSPPARDWNTETHAEELIKLVFAGRIRWGTHSVPPFQPISIYSAGRPRWMTQLCRMSGVEAARVKADRIGLSEINSVMRSFGRYRLSDIYKEHLHQFGDLQRIVEIFANGARRYGTVSLLQKLAKEYVLRVGAAKIPPLDGFPYESPYQLAHLLYKVGFLLGRVGDPESGTAASFVRFDERPELLTNFLNPDDSMLWEIHPSYRTVLGIR